MTMTLEALAAEVTRQKDAAKDYVADTRRVSFTETDAAWLNGEGVIGEDPLRGALPSLLVDIPEGAAAFRVSRHAHQQIAEKIDVQFKTYERLMTKHPELFTHLTNGLLNREPSKRLIRTLDGTVRAVLSNGYQPRDNWQLLENLLPVLAEFPQVEFRSCELTDTRMYVKAFLPNMLRQITPEVGDVIRGGVIFQNSEVGDGSLGIYPYTDRLICKNGMVHTVFGQRSIHVGRRIPVGEEAYEFYSTDTMKLDAAAFFAKCKDTLRGCLNEAVFDAIADQMRDLDGIRIPGSPVEAVKSIAKDKGFSESEQHSILEHLIQGGSLTGWGYVNAITATARDLDADRQTELQSLAGEMTANPAWAEKIAA